MAKQDIDYRAMRADQMLAAMDASVNGAERRIHDHIKAEFRKLHPALHQAIVRSIVEPLLEELANDPVPDERRKAA